MQNFRAIDAISFELSREKKLTTSTHFRETDFFFNVDHIILTKDIEKFDNYILTPIQGFPQKKIEKAKGRLVKGEKGEKRE